MRTFGSEPVTPSDDPGRDLAALILYRACLDAANGTNGVCVQARAWLLTDEAAQMFAACDIDAEAAWAALVASWAEVV